MLMVHLHPTSIKQFSGDTTVFVKEIIEERHSSFPTFCKRGTFEVHECCSNDNLLLAKVPVQNASVASLSTTTSLPATLVVKLKLIVVKLSIFV